MLLIAPTLTYLITIVLSILTFFICLDVRRTVTETSATDKNTKTITRKWEITCPNLVFVFAMMVTWAAWVHVLLRGV